jgi:hypothetical protein
MEERTSRHFPTFFGSFPKFLDSYVLIGAADFMIRIFAKDIDGYKM